MKDLNIKFLGFEDTYVIKKFKEVYDENNDIYNLNKWEEYEKNNPRIFLVCISFGVKKFKI